MDLITGAHTVAAVLLIISGTFKMSDPMATVEFLGRLGVPVPTEGRWARWLGRAIAAFEIVVGTAVLVAGGPLTAALVGAVYVVFTVLVAVAVRRGIDSCACFGRSDTPPTVRHGVIDAALAAVSFAAMSADTPLEVMDRQPGGGVGFVIIVGVAAGVVYGLFEAGPGDIGRGRGRGQRI